MNRELPVFSKKKILILLIFLFLGRYPFGKAI